MSAETLLIILFVGLVAGWLAGQIVQGTGFGLVADIAIGIVGALIGSWLATCFGHPSWRGDRPRHHRRHSGCSAASADSPPRLPERPMVVADL
jgi:hypothetical protein